MAELLLDDDDILAVPAKLVQQATSDILDMEQLTADVGFKIPGFFKVLDKNSRVH